MFSIDARPFQYAVNKWKASVKLAEIELADANKLVTGGNIARIARDQKQAAYDEAKAQLENAQYELENTVVLAPAEGYVALNTLRPGQRVSSRTAALTFIDVSEIFIAAIMKQNGLAGIAPGKRATVSFSAAPGEIFQAEVVGHSAGGDPGSGNHRVRVINHCKYCKPHKLSIQSGLLSLRMPPLSYGSRANWPR